MSDASFVRNSDLVRQTLQAAASAMSVRQLPDGRAGILDSTAGAAIGDSTTITAGGQWTFPKVAGVSFLDGGRAYWNHATRLVGFKRLPGDQDFYLGRFVGDSAPSDGTCIVNLGIDPKYDLDLMAQPFTTLPILTAGVPRIDRRGGAHLLSLDGTSEAQKIDGLSDDGFSTVANAVVEAAIKVVADDSGTAGVFSLGIASATHATTFTSIANSLGVQIKAHDTHVYAESKTASVTVAPTDTLKTYTPGTRFEVWLDLRNPASVGIYVDGVKVLTGSVFDVSASAVPWYLLAHLVKSSSADVMSVQLDWLRARIGEQ